MAGRRINDNMGKYIAEIIVKKMVQADIPIKQAKVSMLGFTFKENCPDTRNSKVYDIVKELGEYGIQPVIADPVADRSEAYNLYNIEIHDVNSILETDVLVIAVSHDEFKKYTYSTISGMYSDKKCKKVLIDVKGIYDKKLFDDGFIYWRL